MSTESSTIGRPMKLSARALALAPVSEAARSDKVTIAADVLKAVHDALIGGETHYTNRPGIPALRSRVADELQLLGGPAFDPNLGVVITAGVREALFVTMLGLRLLPGEVIVGGPDDGGEFADLFSLIGLRPVSLGDAPSSSADARLVYHEREQDDTATATLIATATGQGLPLVLNIRSSIGSDRAATLSALASHDQSMVVGDLDALPGIAAFRVGFVAGPAALVAGARLWKQAFSICTAAPSQRAALIALDRRRKEAR